jgi:hypothetical protein
MRISTVRLTEGLISTPASFVGGGAPRRDACGKRTTMGDKSPKAKEKAKNQGTKDKNKKAANAKNKADNMAPKKKA